MHVTKDELISKLKDAGVSFEEFEHPPVMTVEAQISALPGNPKTVLKNLFLKDKKHRCYIITALPETKIDLQVLGARLGVGKGGTRLAPEELLTAVLQVPLGSVTPLAVANPEAANVVLLLDSKIQDPAHVPADGGVVYVHPLVNTTSLAMTPGALADAIKALGRQPLFVDLEADPKIDRDNPPDLKAIADAAQPPPQALPEAPAGAAATATTATATAAPAAGGGGAAAPAATTHAKDPKKDAKKGGGKGTDQRGAATKASAAAATTTAASLTSVGPRVEELLRAVCGALLDGSSLEEVAASGRVDAYGMARLRAELEMQLGALKNAAYAAGYVAGKGEMVAHAERRFA